MTILNEKRRGLKLTVIDQHDYEDYREVMDAIIKLCYKATIVDNGNTVLEKILGDQQ